MARIRTIKPETPESQSLGRCSRDARLLFILMWTRADDEGRLRAAPALLAGNLFPFDRDAPKLVVGWLDELEQHGHITRYTVENSDYIALRNWDKHQKIDHPTKSRIPAPPGDFSKPRETSRETPSDSHALAPDLGPRTVDQDQKKTARETRAGSLEGFDQVWVVWPNKVKKPSAMKAFSKAIAAGATVEQIVAGIERYKRSKPDWQNWPHLATWLNDRQWEDEGLVETSAMSDAERTELRAKFERRAACAICRGEGMVKLRYGARHGHNVGKPVTTNCLHDAAALRAFCARGGYEWPDDPGVGDATGSAGTALARSREVSREIAKQPPMLLPIAGSQNTAPALTPEIGVPVAKDPLDIPQFLKRSA